MHTAFIRYISLAIGLGYLCALSLGADSVLAQSAAQDSLVAQLRKGGLVLVMRHASSPREAPPKDQANKDNLKLERQLDETGRRTATAMGTALRELKIPMSAVFTSPTYRAMETVRLARLDKPMPVDELGDGGQSMQGVSDAQAEWLRQKAADVPKSGNIMLVTHQPNLTKAFPDWGSTVADGETVVLRPDGKGKSAIVARVPIERWPEER